MTNAIALGFLFIVSILGWLGLYCLTGLVPVLGLGLVSGGLAVWLGRLIASGRAD